MSNECGICFNEYDRSEHRPVVGRCGHSYCYFCSIYLEDGSCPSCRKIGAFIEAPTNFALLEQLEKENVKEKEESSIVEEKEDADYQEEISFVMPESDEEGEILNDSSFIREEENSEEILSFLDETEDLVESFGRQSFGEESSNFSITEPSGDELNAAFIASPQSIAPKNSRRITGSNGLPRRDSFFPPISSSYRPFDQRPTNVMETDSSNTRGRLSMVAERGVQVYPASSSVQANGPSSRIESRNARLPQKNMARFATKHFSRRPSILDESLLERRQMERNFDRDAKRLAESIKGLEKYFGNLGL